MQISLGEALCTFFFLFGGVKKVNPLRRVLQSLTTERVGGGMYGMGAEVSWEEGCQWQESISSA